jgi:hypothetical protein
MEIRKEEEEEKKKTKKKAVLCSPKLHGNSEFS